MSAIRLLFPLILPVQILEYLVRQLPYRLCFRVSIIELLAHSYVLGALSRE